MFVDKAKDLRVPTYRIPPAYLRVYEDGRMLYSARVNYDLSCPMSFQSYPVDTQDCEVIFESWGSPMELLTFRWNEEDCLVNEKITLNQHYFEATFENNDDKVGLYSTGRVSLRRLRLFITLIIFSLLPSL